MPLRIMPQKDGSLLVGLKVVPGASRQRIVGLHGDRLKVAVSAPPEAGKANIAVCQLLAETLGLAARNVTLHAGGGTPFKTVRMVGLTAEQLCQRLGL